MALTDLLPVIFIGITLLGALIQITQERRSIPLSRKIEILLTWAFLLIIGVGGVWAFIGHTLFADRVAASIGWPAGNPFQQEIAFSNLAIGILGLLSVKIHDSFRVATLIAYGVFMDGAGFVHIWQILSTQNMSINNAGLILWVDICMPLVLIVLYYLSLTLKKQESQPSLH